MQGKLVWAFALVGILVVIGSANGCKLCGVHWCSCGAGGHAPPSYSRSWDVEHRSGPPLHLTVPVIQPPALPGLGLGLGLGGGIGGGIGGGNLCQHCGGYNRGGYHGYSPRDDYGYPRGGYTCRCAPRRPRYRYDDY